MLKGERDLWDQALKCMVRGILMAEFREIEVFDPTVLSPIIIYTFCMPVRFFCFFVTAQQYMCMSHGLYMCN